MLIAVTVVVALIAVAAYAFWPRGSVAPYLIYYSVTWCPHCTKMTPIIDRVESDIRVVRYDGDKTPSPGRRYPTILYIDGRTSAEYTGGPSEIILRRWIAEQSGAKGGQIKK